jgi:hypothetical protein
MTFASPSAPGQGVSTLEELNAQFSLWWQSVDHARVPSSTGLTPTERSQRGAHLLKALDSHLDLDQLFDHPITRTVRRDLSADRQAAPSASTIDSTKSI